MYSIRGDQKLHDLWVKSSQMPVVQFQWNTATSFYLCTIYGLFQRYGPKKTKYFLSSLLQKNSTNPFYTPLVTFNYYSVFAKHPRHNSDNLYDYYLSFFSLASLLLIAIQDFATLVLMFLGLSSSITINNVLLGALRTGTHFTRA